MSSTGAASTSFPILSPVEVSSLVGHYRQTHEVHDADRLLRSHYRLVAKIAHEYAWSRQDVRDLIQVGSLGFLRALETYDPHRGVHLSTYGAHWIRSYIRRHVLDNWRLVRIGKTQRERHLFHHRGADVVLDPAEAMLRNHVGNAEQTLDAPLSSADRTEASTRLTLLPGSDRDRPDIQAENDELRGRIRAALDRFAMGLAGRDLRILDARWRTQTPCTLAALALELGLSRERVRQLERRLLDRLRSLFDEEIGDLQQLSLAA